MALRVSFGEWEVESLPEDGGRLSFLRFLGRDLLTQKPESFHAPIEDFGLFETRPVYGYDDCFPSADPCRYPTVDWQIPDHGELCWLKWEARQTLDSLEFQARSLVLPIRFQRRMTFAESSLTWSFRVANSGLVELPFQHVMHPLMPLREITSISLPDFSRIVEDYRKEKLSLTNPEEVEKWLLGHPAGKVSMLYLQRLSTGRVTIGFSNDLRISVEFPVELFSTLGIWWDNEGYPDEEGCRRVECAFEPIPGSASRLSEAYLEGKCLRVKPGEAIAWNIRWIIEKAQRAKSVS